MGCLVNLNFCWSHCPGMSEEFFFLVEEEKKSCALINSRVKKRNLFRILYNAMPYFSWQFFIIAIRSTFPRNKNSTRIFYTLKSHKNLLLKSSLDLDLNKILIEIIVKSVHNMTWKPLVTRYEIGKNFEIKKYSPHIITSFFLLSRMIKKIDFKICAIYSLWRNTLFIIIGIHPIKGQRWRRYKVFLQVCAWNTLSILGSIGFDLRENSCRARKVDDI